MFDPETIEQIRATVATHLPRLGTSLLVLAGFWLASLVVRGIIVRVGTARGMEPDLTRFVARLARTTVMVFGVVTALGTAGVDVAALVAGLGLTGFALGFALKDIISNVLAGILILAYKPFRYGDVITVTSFQGRVVEIDLRYTTLDAGERRFFVPNSLLFTNAITVDKAARPAG